MNVFPVIHVGTVEQVVRDVDTVRRHPISGVFLIDHDADDARLADAILAVRRAHPNLFVGANVLRRTRVPALEVLRAHGVDPQSLDALWTDDAHLDPATALTAVPPSERPLHFGGIAFKYQEPVALADLPALGARARSQVDVPTTSGPGTGREADLSRLRALREGLGDHPLALASGVTPDNVTLYRGLVTHVLVATGIAAAGGGIDEKKLATLLDRASG